jgi:putative redox protein
MANTVVHLGDSYRTTIQVGDHTFHADEPVSDGGTDTAPSPMQMLLGALGSCMAITARMYALRKGWPLEGVDVTLDIERFRGKDYPGYDGAASFVHEVRDHIVFHGPLDDEQLARLREIASRCPVHRAVENPAFFVELEDALEDETTP